MDTGSSTPDSYRWTCHRGITAFKHFPEDDDHNRKCFTKQDLERITSNYSTIIKQGSFGQVYEGVLEDMTTVAVVRFIDSVKENFTEELTVHSRINHRNVVRLIGSCVEENALALITEYMPNGNLSDILHHDNTPISLDERLRIAEKCAKALAYMHDMYTPVIHGDIKPSNILLDGRHVKILLFGISRLVNTDEALYAGNVIGSTGYMDPLFAQDGLLTMKSDVYTGNVIGSTGYMDPLFAQDGLLTMKSDVYSFGIVLLELITRKKATMEDGEGSIIDLFTNALARGVRGVRSIVDAEIASRKNMKILEEVAKLAGDCIRMERDGRPGINEVVFRLWMIRGFSHQGQRRVDLFSWARKSKSALAAVVSIPIDCMHDVIIVMAIRTRTFLSDTWRQFIFSRTKHRYFSLSEMKEATNNFDASLLIGESALGGVYRGEVDGGRTKVAIKRFKLWCVHYAHEFNAEIQMLSKFRHRHLVSLIGYCDEKDEMILVYDYIAHGSLHERLYNTQDPPLTWKERLNICIGVARGLDYLHRGTKHVIIHGKLKLTNILLDENLVAKITDAGLSKPGVPIDIRIFWDSHVLQDPEYARNRPLTVKSDVYSFGVVLFEVLSRRPVEGNIRIDSQQRVWMMSGSKWCGTDRIIDSYIKENVGYMALDEFRRIAAKCISDQGTRRPSMGDVLSELEGVLRMYCQCESMTGGI
ncbi:hypothetical protein EJB05_06357, partial [Eragrostis curvula]